jgi:Cu/Ag efflux protein CusF
MKTIRITPFVTGAVVALSFTYASLAGDSAASAASSGPDHNPAQEERMVKADLVSVDPANHTLMVKKWFRTRDFNTGSDCKVTLEDKPDASLADLRPGEQVDILYQDVNGVRIAQDIAQHDFSYMGHVAAINPADRSLTLHQGIMTRQLTIAPDCAVILNNNKNGDLADVQIGDPVRVVYQEQKGSPMAVRIEQAGDNFAGTIQAIDATSQSIKLKDYAGEKTFALADGCPIVVNGRLNGSLSDLRIGDRVSVSYENADGVFVANRVSPINNALTAAPAAPATGRTTAANEPPPTSYGY